MGQAERKGKEAWRNFRKTRMETICFEWTPKSTIRKVNNSHNSCEPDADGQSDTHAVWGNWSVVRQRKTGCLPSEELGDFLRARKGSNWSSIWAAGRRGGREKSVQRENQGLLGEACSGWSGECRTICPRTLRMGPFNSGRGICFSLSTLGPTKRKLSKHCASAMPAPPSPGDCG